MKAIFLPYVSIADMLTQTFGPDCEVVLHDLSDPEHSVVYVSNGAVTGRRPGDSFDQLVRQVILSDERQGDYAANYYFTLTGYNFTLKKGTEALIPSDYSITKNADYALSINGTAI